MRPKNSPTEHAQQVVELFRAPASVGCCSGAAKMPVLRQRHDALALIFFLQMSGWQRRRGNSSQPRSPRHQLAVLHRQARKPKLRPADRLLWVGLRRFWPRWQHALLLFQPQIVIAWYCRGFRLFWRWKSRGRSARPSTNCELTALVQRMWQANPSWGSRRIQTERAKLGIPISDSTVRKYRPKHRRSASAKRADQIPSRSFKFKFLKSTCMPNAGVPALGAGYPDISRLNRGKFQSISETIPKTSPSGQARSPRPRIHRWNGIKAISRHT